MREIDRIGELLPAKIDALLVAGGTRPARNMFILAASRSQHIVAIDGGLRHVRHFAVTPEIVIGDFDSAKPEDIAWARRRRAHVVLRSDQNSSDMDKALALCHKMKWKNIVIAASDGSRPDHFLYAISKSLHSQKSALTFLFRNSLARTLAGRSKIILPIGCGNTLSWLGFMQATGATLSDVKWPFANKSLEYGKFDSLSNVAIDDVVEFSQKSGRSLIIIPTGKV